MTASAGAPRGRVSVGHIALAVPIIAAVISGRIPVRDNSYLWHVRAGTLQIDLGRVLTEDPFSFTALSVTYQRAFAGTNNMQYIRMAEDAMEQSRILQSRR